MNKFDFEQHLIRQREFSEKTFGPNFNFKGVINHIEKELKEIENDPHDLVEWIDIVLLALDGAWRAGYSPQQIINALVYKQTKNENRTWPDWRTVDPTKAIEHTTEALIAKVRFYHNLEDGWYWVGWADGTNTEFNHWFDAKKEIERRHHIPKWDCDHDLGCPSELRL